MKRTTVTALVGALALAGGGLTAWTVLAADSIPANIASESGTDSNCGGIVEYPSCRAEMRHADMHCSGFP